VSAGRVLRLAARAEPLPGEARPDDEAPVVLDSCHSTWIFEVSTMRFQRLLKGVRGDSRTVATDWRPYHRVEVSPDSESFAVMLNGEGTRWIRSWRHTVDCPQCGDPATAAAAL